MFPALMLAFWLTIATASTGVAPGDEDSVSSVKN